MGTRVLFWFLFYPLSIIPLELLYVILYPFYLTTRYIIRYRRTVIDDNFHNSFPDWDEHKIKKMRGIYYWHLTQTIAEAIKMVTISRRNVLSRYHCSNPELVNKFFDEGKSVILVSSHYNNWEWMVLSLNMQFKQKGIGIGAPNSNKIFEKLINRARTRYGTDVVFANTVRDTFQHLESSHTPASYMILADQSPSNPERCYVTQFLHHKTGFLRGAEGFARKYDLPVLYYQVIRKSLGHYQIDIQNITEHPNTLPEGAIMQRYVELLEKTIISDPPNWLWSHRRWKMHFD